MKAGKLTNDPNLQYLITTFARIRKGDCLWLLRLTSPVSTAQRARLLPALNLKDFRQPQFGMRVAFPIVERRTPC